jgi:hypothetical protein
MTAEDPVDSAFELMVKILEPRVGENRAITIDDLAIRSGLVDTRTDPVRGVLVTPRRRIAERILETRFHDFPYLLVSSCKGYFRPATVEELNRWWAASRSRILANAIRMRIGRQKAPANGFRYAGQGRFERLTPKTDLFE